MTCYAKPYEGDQDYVFFSYCHENEPLVYPIIERLAIEGFRVWFDDGIHPGDDWLEVIGQHLKRARVVIAVISKASVESHNCRNEVNFAVANQRPLISVILDDNPMPVGIQLQLSSSNYIKPYELEPEVFYQKLLAAPNLTSCRNAGVSATPEMLQMWKTHVRDYIRNTSKETSSLIFDDDWFEEETIGEEIRKLEKEKKEAERKKREAEEAKKQLIAAAKKAEEERLAAARKAEEERRAAEQEEKERLAAEKKAEEERLAAARKAEEERRAAEQEEKERLAAEKKAKEERLAAEQAELERIARKAKEEELRRLTEQKAEEKARREAERKARQERLAEEKRRAEEERQHRAEEEKKRREKELAALKEKTRQKAIEQAQKDLEEEQRKKLEEETRRKEAEEIRKMARLAISEMKKREVETMRKIREASEKNRNSVTNDYANTPIIKKNEINTDRKASEKERDEALEQTVYISSEEVGAHHEKDDSTVLIPDLEEAFLYRVKTGEFFRIVQQKTLLGRSKQADISISGNLSISREQAEILAGDGQYQLHDINHTADNVVNGSLVAKGDTVSLPNLAEIQMGNEQFWFFGGAVCSEILRDQTLALLKCRKTGEVRPVTGEILPMNRYHKWRENVLGDNRISRENHAEIVRTDGESRITDVGSIHGTFVNGRRLRVSESVPLRNGDRIRIVATEFQYQEVFLG